MARAVYPHEVADPDFQWLLNNYCENHPGSFKLDAGSLPVVIIVGGESLADQQGEFQRDEVPTLLPGASEDSDISSHKK